MDDCAVFGIGAIALVPLLFVYVLQRSVPRNVGRQHGGGLAGTGPIWGYPPLDDEPREPGHMPVEPSGTPVGPEVRLEAGSSVLANRQGAWWRAKVIALEPGDRVRIHYVGWDASWDESVPRSALQIDVGKPRLG